MPSLVLDNIATLVTCASPGGSRAGQAMSDVGVVRSAQVVIEGDRITHVGAAGDTAAGNAVVIDCTGRTVLPGFVDSHTHIVHAGDRSDEFARRLRGVTYQEIAAEGGGILSTMRAVRASSVEQLVEHSRPFVQSAFAHGSTTIEAKSGYGLDLRSELNLLEAINAIGEEGPATLVPTFLGAHDIPPELRHDRESYVNAIIEVMIPEVEARGLAMFCDVFTDTGYFTVEESERIFNAASAAGLRLKAHADELSSFGAAEMSARIGAVSADHLLCISDDGIDQMNAAGVVATLLPGTAFFLGLPYAPARRMISEGMTVALATDCNPGSNLCENMQVTLALACMGMRMSVEEALVAATINGAAALGMSESIGSIEEGKVADMVIFDVPDYPAIVYHYGVNHVCTVIKRGVPWSIATGYTPYRP